MMDPHAPAPGPYNWESVTARHGSSDGHVYLVDAAGRKIGVVWGRTGEKCATAELLSLAPWMFSLLRLLEPDQLARRIGRTSPLRKLPAPAERDGDRRATPIGKIRETLR
jgi:hypothetical protein